MIMIALSCMTVMSINGTIRNHLAHSRAKPYELTSYNEIAKYRTTFMQFTLLLALRFSDHVLRDIYPC